MLSSFTVLLYFIEGKTDGPPSTPQTQPPHLSVCRDLDLVSTACSSGYQWWVQGISGESSCWFKALGKCVWKQGQGWVLTLRILNILSETGLKAQTFLKGTSWVKVFIFWLLIVTRACSLTLGIEHHPDPIQQSVDPFNIFFNNNVQ